MQLYAELLKDKVCVVTGGNRGIGAAICESFALSGASVFAAQRSRSEIEAYSEAASKRVKPICLDVRDPESISKAAEKIFATESRLDVWVNCAGITGSILLPSIKDADWEEVVDTNLSGTMRGVRAATRYMMIQKSGSIINISSIASRRALPGQSHYVASKAAIEGFTRAAAVELGPKNIRVNAIAPGFVMTTMAQPLLRARGETIIQSTPLRRIADPQDIADVAIFLASDLSRYITGCVLPVDGGSSIAWSS